jgi:hypothetical protein
MGLLGSEIIEDRVVVGCDATDRDSTVENKEKFNS